MHCVILLFSKELFMIKVSCILLTLAVALPSMALADASSDSDLRSAISQKVQQDEPSKSPNGKSNLNAGTEEGSTEAKSANSPAANPSSAKHPNHVRDLKKKKKRQN